MESTSSLQVVSRRHATRLRATQQRAHPFNRGSLRKVARRGPRGSSVKQPELCKSLVASPCGESFRPLRCSSWPVQPMVMVWAMRPSRHLP
eukprot:1380273-Amphidinium_carterae.2